MALNLSKRSLLLNWKLQYLKLSLPNQGLHSYVTKLFVAKQIKGSVYPVVNTKKIHGPQPQDEYTKEAKYPPIKQYKTRDDEEEAKLVDFVKSLDTVEEKLYHINKPKYYGWQSVIIHAKNVQPTSLDFAQYATNTTTIENELPAIYNLKTPSGKELELLEGAEKRNRLINSLDVNNHSTSEPSNALEVQTNEACEKIEPYIRDFILDFEAGIENSLEAQNDKILYREVGARPKSIAKEKEIRTNAFVWGIHKVIASHLARMNIDHLSLNDSSVDYLPRNEAFWFRGPMDANKNLVMKREGRERYNNRAKGLPIDQLDKEKIHQPHDRAIQFIGNAILQLRTKNSLAPFLTKEDDLCTDGYVPEFTYDPKYLGYPRVGQHGSNLSGHWTGVDKGSCHLQIVSSIQNNEMSHNSTAWDTNSQHSDRPDMLTSKAILSGFGQCLAQACFQGFSPLNDPINPLTNQTIVTDGQRWKFAVYQLNKTALQGLSENAPKMVRNVCWHLPEMELYSHVDVTKKEVIGFSSLVLKTLIKFYLIEPRISNVENEGYLGERKYLFNVNDNYDRQYFHEALRTMYSKRSRHFKKPSIEPHERLFYLRHPHIMSPMGLREQPWFVLKDHDFKGKEHWNPELKHFDYHNGPYIPKKFRPPKRSQFEIHPGAKTLRENRGKVVTTPIAPDTKK